ncbi:MAG: adenosine deaminase [Deltaproteobacteria bacterium]|nr:adenosine deaminase [Deltaproteobacteria bacterium]
MKQRITLCVLLVTMLVPAFATAGPALSKNEKAAVQFFKSIHDSPPMLRGFLGMMPKGADLHTHLSGAVYAEDYLQWAVEDGRCIDTTSFTIVSADGKTGTDQPQCPAGAVFAAELAKNSTLYSAAVNALSTRNMDSATHMWGHDQFFSTFGRFGAAKQDRDADMLATVVRRAASQGILYVEVMDSIYPDNLKSLAEEVGWNGDPAAALAALRSAGLFNGIEQSVAARGETLRRMDELLGTGPGSSTTLRFIQQVTRTAPPAQVFAQIAYSFELVRQDPNVVAFNLVAPEDNPVALRDYSLQMEMIDALSALPEYAGTAITLHAGELSMGLVPPRYLRFHISEAVEKGHARRIGHGVDVMYEENPFALLRTMREKGVAVEICLSSNDQILHVAGPDHPFPIYRRYGVPVVLNTDDEGVGRIDLTNEYVRAVLTYNLGYEDVKALSRNSLEYSFLPGKSLWVGNPAAFEMRSVCQDSLAGQRETPQCDQLLKESEKARLQWELEKAFAAFEREMAHTVANR